MTRTPWFCSGIEPKIPGVYLTRSTYSGNEHLAWWRAFDGENWHAGIMAVDTKGIGKSAAPDYHTVADTPIIGSHISIQWCGLTESPSEEFA